jgi:uncharacterized protein
LNKKLDVIDLVELQYVENAISARSSELERLKNNTEAENTIKKLEEKESKYKETIDRYHEIDISRKKLEDNVDTNEEKIKSNEKKLFSGTITSSKELESYQEEIDMLKKSNSNMEDKILELMEEQEIIELEIETLKKEIESLKSDIKRINSEIEEKMEGIRHNIEGLKRRREDVISRIPPEDLKKYNIIKTKKGGIAVSVIKDSFCSACNMEVPLVEAEKLVDSDKLYICPMCGRLAVLHQPEIDRIIKELES